MQPREAGSRGKDAARKQPEREKKNVSVTPKVTREKSPVKGSPSSPKRTSPAPSPKR